MSGHLDFDAIEAAALAQASRLLREWFPNGKVSGREFLIGNINGDPGESLSFNLNDGLWKDFGGGAAGYGVIGLRAAQKHGGSDKKARTAAARELRDMLGLRDSGKQGRQAGAKPSGTNGSANGSGNGAGHHDADDWTPIVPVPAGTPKPDPRALFSDFNGGIWQYCDTDDRLLFYVGRIDPLNGGRKQFGQVVYGSLGGRLGWYRKWPAGPYPLFGLNRLRPGAPVILCEGEKAADAAQAIFPNSSCLSWFGGASCADKVDLEPLRGLSVIVCPDADETGRKAGATIAARLQGIAASVQVMRTDGLPEKADFDDGIVEGDPEEWLRARLGDPDKQEEAGEAGPEPPPHPDDGAGAEPLIARMIARCSIDAWEAADIPPDEPIVGHLIVRGSRAFFSGNTGTGKTLFGVTLSLHAAEGVNFLHWQVPRPSRVLYFDGEMPAGLARTRLLDERQRFLDATGRKRPAHPENLLVVSSMRPEQLREIIGQDALSPLNSDAGGLVVLRLIDAFRPDVVVFDNVQSLLIGVQKEEETWGAVKPLVAEITRRGIAQIWFDHTDRGGTRQYGSVTKAWTFDLAGVLKAVTGNEAAGADLAMSLSFQSPEGKARRRTPDNRADFEDCIIRLTGGRWTSEAVKPDPSEDGGKRGRGRPMDDDTVLMQRAIELLASDKGVAWTVVQADTPPVKAIRRDLLRKHLVNDGWFGAGVDYSPNSGEFSEQGYKREYGALRTLKRRKIIGFTKEHVWPNWSPTR